MTQTLAERAYEAAVIGATAAVIWVVVLLIGGLLFRKVFPGTFGALVRVLKGIDKTLAALNRNLDRANVIAEKASNAAVHVKRAAVDAAGNMRAAGGVAVDGIKNAGGAAAEYGAGAVDGLKGAAANVGIKVADAAKAMPMNFMKRDAVGAVGDK